jgi:hypothetical protein
MKEALGTWKEIREDEDKKLITAEETVEEIEPVVNIALMQPGLTLIAGKGKILKAAVVDAQGNAVQEWAIDWQSLWPEASHLPKKDIPKQQPGTHIHGAVLMDNGDLVFNFEHLGMMRLDPCNQVVWRLPYRTHHSIHVDRDGMLWASGQRNHTENSSLYPNYKAPFVEPTIVKVSPEGELLLEQSVMALLAENGLNGLLYLQGKNSFTTETSADTLHLNDVETFDFDTPAGAFSEGDIMISLRNINTVLVFDSDWKLKHRWSSDFVRQHDPDFIDADSISLYDNNFIGESAADQGSRILIKNLVNGEQSTWFRGTPDSSFFSFIMGKHQWLDNGNVLIAETTSSRAFELTPDREIVWEYYHRNEEGKPDLLEEAQRLPSSFTSEFFEQRRRSCQAD